MQTRYQQKMPKLQGFGGSNSPNPAIGGLGLVIDLFLWAPNPHNWGLSACFITAGH